MIFNELKSAVLIPGPQSMNQIEFSPEVESYSYIVNSSLEFSPDLTGFWTLSNPDPKDHFKVVFEIKSDVDKGYLGNTHIYYHDFKYTTDTLLDINFNGKLLTMLSHPGEGQVFEGEMSSNAMFIHGKLVNQDGSSNEHILIKLKRENVTGITPFPIEDLNEDGYVYNPPSDLSDGIKVSTIKEEGIGLDLMDTLVDKILTKKVGEVHSALIAKNGKLVFEEYFYGHNQNSLQACHSTTKSIASLIVGISHGSGEIQDLDRSIWDYYPEYHDLQKTGNSSITLKHLLTMTAGFNPEDQHWDSDKSMYRNLLSRDMTSAPGVTFHYDGGCSNLLGNVLYETTGFQVDLLAESRLFEPLDINYYHWMTDTKDDLPLLDGGLSLRSRDMLKIGLLVSNGGIWNGEQIVPVQWIKESTKTHVSITGWGEEEYGYHWWLEKPGSHNNIEPIIYAQGMGFQLIMVVPEQQLVMVVTAGNYQGMDKNFELWNIIHQFIE
jgi:CubicO group peptidase (beta-lactamase class C family)